LLISGTVRPEIAGLASFFTPNPDRQFFAMNASFLAPFSDTARPELAITATGWKKPIAASRQPRPNRP